MPKRIAGGKYHDDPHGEIDRTNHNFNRNISRLPQEQITKEHWYCERNDEYIEKAKRPEIKFQNLDFIHGYLSHPELRSAQHF